MFEAIIINDVDLASVASCVTSLDGLYQSGTPRGDNLIVPGVDGELYVDKAYQANVIELGIFLAGSTTAELNSAFRTLKRLVQPGRQLHLQRRMSFVEGDETHEAFGEYVSGLNPTVQLMRFGRTTLGLRILGGLWYATAPVTVSTSTGSVDALGETRTHRMLVTMPPGTTVTNTTTGHTMTNTAGAGSNVVVDVENLTATQDGVDVSSTLTFNRRYPMRLVPGVQSFTGATVDIQYYPAYL